METIGGTKLRRNHRHLKVTRSRCQPLISSESVSNDIQQEQAETEVTNQLVSPAEDQLNQPPASQSNKQQEAPLQTRSDRMVVKPARYEDYVCNSVSCEKYSEVFV